MSSEIRDLVLNPANYCSSTSSSVVLELAFFSGLIMKW